MPLPPSVEKLQKEINDELKDLGLKSIRIDGLGPITKDGPSLIWNNPYNGNMKEEYKDEFNKVVEAFKKHFKKWSRKHSKGFSVP